MSLGVTEKFHGSRLRHTINITQIISLHYFEFPKTYLFEGESHDFWELVYVDRGEVLLTADDKVYTVNKGEMLFHKPGQFHAVESNGRSPCNLIVICFVSKSPSMHFFEDKIFLLDDRKRALLSQIMAEGKNSFDSPLDDPGLKKLTRRRESPFGAEQLLKLSLESLLIHFVRGDSMISRKERLTASMRDTQEDRLAKAALSYLEENLHGSVTLDEAAGRLHVGKSYLKRLFRERTGGSLIDTFIRMKIEEAKRLIREESYNVTQIAELLGFSSVHYFSRSFKRVTGMTPSEYALSIKALARL